MLQDSLVREQNCIHLSKTKDPQMEQLGTWYKSCISLLYSLHDINQIQIHSDTRIEIVYGTDVRVEYNLVPNPVDGSFVHVHVHYCFI